MLIAKQENGVWEIQEHKVMFPQTSFVNAPNTTFLDANEAYEVRGERTYNQATEKLVSCEPYLEGNYVYIVEVQEKTDEEIASYQNGLASQHRHNRDQLLQKTDWYVIKAMETDTTVPSNIATYRQALRDLPTSSGFPTNVVYPEIEE